MLGGKTLEELAVLSGRGVTFLDFSYWNSVFVENFRLYLLVNDRLDMVLNVVNMSVNIANTFNFFYLDVAVVLVNNVLQMLVVVSDVFCGRVKLGSDGVIVTSGVVEARNASGGSSYTSVAVISICFPGQARWLSCVAETSGGGVISQSRVRRVTSCRSDGCSGAANR